MPQAERTMQARQTLKARQLERLSRFEELASEMQGSVDALDSFITRQSSRKIVPLQEIPLQENGGPTISLKDVIRSLIVSSPNQQLSVDEIVEHLYVQFPDILGGESTSETLEVGSFYFIFVWTHGEATGAG
jgi:hypothetical protein